MRRRTSDVAIDPALKCIGSLSVDREHDEHRCRKVGFELLAGSGRLSGRRRGSRGWRLSGRGRRSGGRLGGGRIAASTAPCSQ